MVYPLKVLTVFLHELSHGLGAVVTGGEIVSIELTANEGGLCMTRGGSAFVVTSAGYLGSALWGALLMVIGFRTRADRGVVAFLGFCLVLLTLRYVRTVFGFTYGLVSGAGLVALAWLLPAAVSDLTLKTIGVVSSLYAVWDIGSDTLVRNVPGSDANALGRITGIPGFVWGMVWVIMAAATTLAALILSSRGTGDRTTSTEEA